MGTLQAKRPRPMNNDFRFQDTHPLEVPGLKKSKTLPGFYEKDTTGLVQHQKAALPPPVPLMTQEERAAFLTSQAELSRKSEEARPKTWVETVKALAEAEGRKKLEEEARRFNAAHAPAPQISAPVTAKVSIPEPFDPRAGMAEMESRKIFDDRGRFTGKYKALAMTGTWRVAGVIHLTNSTPPREFRIFAKGMTETKKGIFKLDAKGLDAILKAQEDWGNAYSLDYEHAAVFGNPEGPTPAAGWYKLEGRDGALWAVQVEWTDRATAYLKAKEYRYYSPTFNVEEGRIVELLNVALTNLPATKNMEPLVNSRSR